MPQIRRRAPDRSRLHFPTPYEPMRLPAPLRTIALLGALLVLAASPARAENGYDLWLRYVPVSDAALLTQYRGALTELAIDPSSPTLVAVRDELRLRRGLS